MRWTDGQPCLRLFTASSLKAVANATRLVTEVREIRQSWDARVRARSGSATWRVANLLLRYPLVTARMLHEHLGTADQRTPLHGPPGRGRRGAQRQALHVAVHLLVEPGDHRRDG